MSNCKNCQRVTEPGKALCERCINNWLVMRGIIQNRLTSQHGEATRENTPIMQREMNRLDALWKRDRVKFSQEVNKWYENV